MECVPRYGCGRGVMPAPAALSGGKHSDITAREAVIFWEDLEASPPMGWPGPMVRMDGSGLAEFRSEVRAFWDAMDEAAEARIAAEIAEMWVTWTREQLAEVCLRYPGAVKSRFRAGHGLLDSVPKPWPQEKKSEGA